MSARLERDVVRELVPELEAEGYDVYLQPIGPIAPSFLGSFQPDIVATSDKKKVVIEVARRSDVTERRLTEIANLFKGHDDWEFRVVWVDPIDSSEKFPPVSKAAIEERLAEVRSVVAVHPGPALLMSWAIFEAIGRALVADEFTRPQTPRRLVEVLAANGVITPTEADEIRALISKRNSLIHGGLTTTVSSAEVERFLSVLDELSSQLSSSLIA
jgi:hypothetical protein